MGIATSAGVIRDFAGNLNAVSLLSVFFYLTI